jgi:hypothetical protein
MIYGARRACSGRAITGSNIFPQPWKYHPRIRTQLNELARFQVVDSDVSGI